MTRSEKERSRLVTCGNICKEVKSKARNQRDDKWKLDTLIRSSSQLKSWYGYEYLAVIRFKPVIGFIQFLANVRENVKN